jgi:hypothetical protein
MLEDFILLWNMLELYSLSNFGYLDYINLSAIRNLHVIKLLK